MKINRVFVCLDLSPYDQYCVAFAHYMAKHVPDITHLLLFHNIRYDFLGSLSEFEPAAVQSLKATIKKEIENKFLSTLKDLNIAIEVEVDDDNNTSNAILKARREEHADLMVMGKKAEAHGAGNIPRTILTTDNRSTAIALVPKFKVLQLKSILAAVDLSDTSKKVIEYSEYLSSYFKSSKTCLNIYKVPATYFPYINIKRENIAEGVKKKSEEKFKSYIASKQLDPGSWDFEILKGENISSSIVEFANKTKPDIVVVGRIGQTNMPGNVIGGVARRMLAHEMDRVMLLV